MYSLRAIGLASAMFLATAAQAQTKTVDSLSATIDARSIAKLVCLTDKSMDQPVMIDLKVAMPADQVEVSGADAPLLFWDKKPAPNGTQFSFPKGTYVRDGNGYAVKGNFMPRYAGMNQGITTIAFDKADPIPGARAADVTTTRCK